MSSNLYGEIRSDLRYVADELEDNGITDYKAYNHGVQFNITDNTGIIHSYYPTTGTALFHHSNDRKDHKTFTIRNLPLDIMIEYIQDPETIKELFR